MSTQAIYSFVDESGTARVFKHWDNYPEGAALFLNKAKELAWPLPRFEADEFAAAFIAANKTRAGDLRVLTREADNERNICMSVDYMYKVALGHDGNIYVDIFERDWNTDEFIFRGGSKLDDMKVLGEAA